MRRSICALLPLLLLWPIVLPMAEGARLAMAETHGDRACCCAPNACRCDHGGEAAVTGAAADGRCGLATAPCVPATPKAIAALTWDPSALADAAWAPDVPSTPQGWATAHDAGTTRALATPDHPPRAHA